MARLITSMFGAALVLYGIVAAVSPLPLGIVCVAIGLLMIASANPAARPIIRRLRARWAWFDALVEAVGRRDPRDFKEVVEETEPPHDGGRAR